MDNREDYPSGYCAVGQRFHTFRDCVDAISNIVLTCFRRAIKRRPSVVCGFLVDMGQPHFRSVAWIFGTCRMR